MVTDKDFLARYYSECQGEMRWRREIEYKLMGIIITINAASLPIVATILKLTDEDKYLKVGLPLCLAISLMLAALLIIRKIYQERHIYKILGKYTIKIWEYFSMFHCNSYLEGEPILEEDARKIGKGKGHKRTAQVIISITSFTVTILLATSLFNYLTIDNKNDTFQKTKATLSKSDSKYRKTNIINKKMVLKNDNINIKKSLKEAEQSH